MRRFAYAGDALCVAACVIYGVNRWLIKPAVSITWAHSWLNDLLLIPAALPFLLGLQRWLNLRRHDDPPSWAEIAAHLIGWSILFEVAGPFLAERATGDAWDVVAYAAGAAISGCWWNRGDRLETASAKEEASR